MNQKVGEGRLVDILFVWPYRLRTPLFWSLFFSRHATNSISWIQGFHTLKKHQITLQIFRERSSGLWKIILNSHYYLSTISILSEKFLNSNVLSLKEVHRMILKSGFVFFHLVLNLVFFYFPWGKEHHFFIFPWNIFFSLVQMKLHYFWWRRKWRCQHLMLIQRHPPHAIKAAAWKGLCVPWTIIRLRRYE